ncbi:MAG: LPXTG cell wall anchor domain-containing protein [Microbacterium sp.]
MIVTAAVLGGAAGAASVTAAVAVPVPLAADFGVLLPGADASASVDVVVPTDAVVAQAEWLELSGPGSWNASLCAAASCTALDELPGTEVPAGSYRVVIDVSMPTDAAAASTSAQGRIALVQQTTLPLTDGELAITGAAAPWIASIVGATALAAGAALLLRRRGRDEESAS